MKNNYLLLLLITVFSFTKSQSQNCKALGCAASFAQRTVITSVSSVFGEPGTCYNTIPYKVATWQYFYSPSGGVYTQTYTPTSAGDPLDLDYIVFDLGLSGPGTMTCPVNLSGYTEILCNLNATFNVPTGPGVDGTLTTVAGHFYAIVIYVWQSSDPTYTFSISAPQISGVNLDALNCPGVLPVKLSSFDARVNNCIVNLDWVTETESNFKYYQVEYSTDGRKFQVIATLTSQGNGSEQKYSYQHNDPLQGNIFYRLKMTDVDGKIETSKTLALKIDCSHSSVFIYPNPVTDILNVNITNSPDLIAASLFDNSGKLVYSGSMKSGTNTIDMKKFAKGIYMLSLKNNEGTQNIKIVK